MNEKDKKALRKEEKPFKEVHHWTQVETKNKEDEMRHMFEPHVTMGTENIKGRPLKSHEPEKEHQAMGVFQKKGKLATMIYNYRPVIKILEPIIILMT